MDFSLTCVVSVYSIDLITSLIGMAVGMRVDLKNNLVPCKKMRTRTCVKSIGERFFFGDKFFTHYDNITENFSLKLVRYNNLNLLFMILSILRKILRNGVIVCKKLATYHQKTSSPLMTFHISLYSRVVIFSRVRGCFSSQRACPRQFR